MVDQPPGPRPDVRFECGRHGVDSLHVQIDRAAGGKPLRACHVVRLRGVGQPALRGQVRGGAARDAARRLTGPGRRVRDLRPVLLAHVEHGEAPAHRPQCGPASRPRATRVTRGGDVVAHPAVGRVAAPALHRRVARVLARIEPGHTGRGSRPHSRGGARGGPAQQCRQRDPSCDDTRCHGSGTPGCDTPCHARTRTSGAGRVSRCKSAARGAEEVLAPDSASVSPLEHLEADRHAARTDEVQPLRRPS